MKILKIILGVSLCFATLVFAAEKLSTKIEAIPKVFQVTGAGAANLAPGMYPLFQNYSGEAACGNTLAGLSGASYGTSFTAVPGMDLEVSVPEAYRQKGSLLITWTLRVEGVTPGALQVWPSLCSTFHGSVDQVFKGGIVESQAWVNLGSGYKALGRSSVMTVPDGGTRSVIQVQDPTHSGSYVLKAADCPGGNLPAKVLIKIYWKNNTALRITSAAHYRSLIVTLVPAN